MADPLHQFVVTPIIPLDIAGIDVSFTNASLWMLIGAVVSTLFLTVSMRRKSLVPGRAQAFSEMLYEFVGSMVRENIGSAGRQYLPLIFTLFVVVLMGNVLGLLPYSFTYTSHLIVTASLAIVVFLTVLVLGLARHGVKFFSLFVPPGVPLWLWPLIIPIELISFVIRPVTLSVRLFANMMAGHLMLKVFAGFSVAMFTALGVTGVLPGLLPMAFNTALTAFELLVALIHAYVFAVLSCIYLKDTVDLHH